MSVILGTGGWTLVAPRGRLSVDPDARIGRLTWAAVLEREQLYATSGDYVLLTPDGGIDRRLRLYFRSMAFDRLASNSKETYALALKTWLDFLHQQGIAWHQATEDDFAWFKRWRLDAAGRERNPHRIQPATWNKEVHGLRLFYDWATDSRRSFVAESPLPSSGASTRHGTRRNPALAKNAKRDRTRWVVPTTARFYRDVGLRGYTVARGNDGRFRAVEPAGSFRGRNVSRNLAFFDLAYSTALRRSEAGSLLLPEIPESAAEVPLAAATAKGGRTRHYVLQGPALAAVHAYIRFARKQAIARARRGGRYEGLDIVYVDGVEIRRRTGMTLVLEDGSSRAVADAPPALRERLFMDRGDGYEPLSLWLSEDGLPMRRKSWEDVFESANGRLMRQMVMAGADSADVPLLSPHSLRSSFALWVLAALHRSIDQREGIHPSDAYDERRYLSAFEIVQDLLGHASVETTRNYYLEPVKGVRRAVWMEHNDDIHSVLSSLAATDARVSDIAER